jgi:aminoglycoside phosphotransferase family enzyme
MTAAVRRVNGSQHRRSERFAAELAFLRRHLRPEAEVETHAAHIFLTARKAWKLKKPIRLPAFDHRSLVAREQACNEGVRLNRQLAGRQIYLGVAPLLLEPDDTFRLGADGAGQLVDWLVVMRRLPEERMLDTMLARGEAPTEADLDAIGRGLASFYAARRAEPARPGIYLAHLRHESAVNRVHLREMATRLGAPDLDQLTAAGLVAIERAARAIRAREAARMVVEGHGDLRPEHICLIRPPVVFDRIECAAQMRMIDIGDELGYLALECRLMGAPRVGARVTADVAAAGFAPPGPELARVYTLFRCLTRARLMADHLREPFPRHGAMHWVARAGLYLSEARRVLSERHERGDDAEPG